MPYKVVRYLGAGHFVLVAALNVLLLSALCYFYLFLCNVAAYFYHLHSVAQRTRNGADIICCSDKHYFREVIVDIEIVVMERVVLFRVKNLKQRR